MSNAAFQPMPEQAPQVLESQEEVLTHELPAVLPRIGDNPETTQLIVSYATRVEQQRLVIHGLEGLVDTVHPGTSSVVASRLDEVHISAGLEGERTARDAVARAALEGVRRELEDAFREQVASEQEARRPEYIEEAKQQMLADGTYAQIGTEERERAMSEASQVARQQLRDEAAAAQAQEFSAQVREAVAAHQESPEHVAEIAAQRTALLAEQKRQQTELYRAAFTGAGLDLRELPKDARLEVRLTQQNVHTLGDVAAAEISSTVQLVSHGEGEYEVLACSAGELDPDEVVALGSEVRAKGQPQYRSELRHGGLLTYSRGDPAEEYQVLSGANSEGRERIADLLIDGQSLMLTSGEEYAQSAPAELERSSAISNEVLADVCRRNGLSWKEIPEGPVKLLFGIRSTPLLPDGTRASNEVVESIIEMKSLGDGTFAVPEGTAAYDYNGNLHTMPAGGRITYVDAQGADGPMGNLKYGIIALRGDWQWHRRGKLRPAEFGYLSMHGLLNVDFGDAPVLPYTKRVLPEK